MDKFGLIGYPLTHSFSKRFFTEKFERENINSIYENYEIPVISDFPGIIKNDPGLKGMNVTIPYKEQVLPYLDEMDDAAREVGAVNTVKIIRNNDKIILKGFYTDSRGFETALKPLLKPHHAKALILGTGG
ncbi:MAG: shikimate dehydrogenase, partial [Prolixibacteraceae bacterium]|nr:shikimate dehydrogenase [Prolixibacteraceae bacterium]